MTKDEKVYTKKICSLNDISMSAYLLMRGAKLLGAKKLGHTYKIDFEAGPVIDQLMLEFINSEFSKYDDSIRKLKKIMYSKSN